MATVASLFSQLLRHFSRAEFGALVKEHQAERHAKGVACRDRFVAMMFYQLAPADNWREICGGPSCCLGKLHHPGVGRAPKRSTLSSANEHRPAGLYEALFRSALERFRCQGGFGGARRRFRFKNKLLSLDTTTISSSLSLFPRADFRRARGGVKVHVRLDHTDHMPSVVVITEARRHDLATAQKIPLAPGSVVAMDRACNDFRLFVACTDQGVFFVTRMKENTVREPVDERPRPERGAIRSDRVIRLTGAAAAARCLHLLRRVIVRDVEKERKIVLLTNHLDFAVSTIAAICKERWQIKLFFQALKQNLKVRTFVGTTENMLRIRIRTALIAMLLLICITCPGPAGRSPTSPPCGA